MTACTPVMVAAWPSTTSSPAANPHNASATATAAACPAHSEPTKVLSAIPVVVATSREVGLVGLDELMAATPTGNAPAAAIAPSAGCPVAPPITSGTPTPSAARVARPGASAARLKARARPTPAGRRIQVILPCRSGIAQTVCLVSVYAHPRRPHFAAFALAAAMAVAGGVGAHVGARFL